ncbi:MAG: aminotransferase class V-fold PLP-dependent enzyme [Clostridiales bacterium]|jgi:cysteine desulfurase|nr:aminotransferase class V-fold PLP-dependent enzyme [Clostridiales bacterium]
MIYLDYAAQTPIDPRSLEAYVRTQREFFANPNSTHPLGLRAADRLKAECARIKACFAGSEAYELIPLGSGSEANNLAVKGIAETYGAYGRHILTTGLEHISTGGAVTYLKAKGFETDIIPIKPDGKIDLAALGTLIRPDTALVSVSYADGELGTVQPIADIARIVGAYPARLHVDAAQAAGKIPIALDGIDTLSFTAYKFYGPAGAAFLLRGENTVLTPLVHGGGASLYRGGTPALALIAAAATALECSLEERLARLARVGALNRGLRERLKALPGVVVNSPPDALPHILNMSLTGFKAEAVKDALGAEGVCVSVKSACSPTGSPSKAVFAVTGDKKRALASFRVSLSHLTAEDDIDGFVSALQRVRDALVAGGRYGKL